jgi:hypothetical protein
LNRLARRQRTIARRLSPLALSRRFLITMFCLLAFGAQSYVAATHIHDQRRGAAVSALQFSVTADAKEKVKPRKNLPVRGDEENCPLCRAVIHAGSFLFPSLQVLELPGDGVVVAGSLAIVVPPASAPSHSWTSRGPPQA